MPYRKHSTFLGVVCGDWANTSDFSDDQSISRVQEIVTFVKSHPANPEEVDPHILRPECPAGVVAKPERTAMFIGLNPAIIRKTWFVIVDGHSDCAGIPELYPEHEGDQFELQHDMIVEGAQRFVNMMSAFSEHPVQGIFSYTQFNHRRVERVRKIITVGSTISFPDGLTMANHPSGKYVPDYAR